MNKSAIKSAINRSSSLNEIARIEISGDSGDALTAIRALVDCEVEYVMADYEGTDIMDVWGFTSPGAAPLWRLSVKFKIQNEESRDASN